MSDYIKTIWQDDITPLSATNLNKIEQGIYNAHTEIDSATTRITNLESKQVNYASAYDFYNAEMSLYYTGHFSGPDIAGMKAMTFDGFIDTSRVDTVNTTALVDTTNKCVRSQDTYAGTVTNAVSSSSTGYSTAYAGDQYGFYLYITTSASLERHKLKGVSLQADGINGTGATVTATLEKDGVAIGSTSLAINTTGEKVFDLSSTNHVLQPSSNYRVVVTSNNSNSGNSVAFAGHQTGSMTVTGGTFGAFWTTHPSSGNNEVYSQRPMVKLQGFIRNGYQTNNKLVATTKALTFTPQKAKLYITSKYPTNTNIVPKASANGGTNYESMTVVSSRPDPKDSAYTEREYEVTFSNSGTSLKLQVDLTSTDGINTVEIKRYGTQLA